jgi:holin-like protein
MRILRQLALIFGFGFAGTVLAYFIPLGLPASVLGLALVLAALGLKLLKPKHLGETADFLTANMAFFFLPATLRILDCYDLVKNVLVQLVGICMICTIVTFLVAYSVTHFARRIITRHLMYQREA